MELRQLSHFVAVAEERSFTRAGQRMHIVQSGISASVAALERELGVPLFQRTGRRVELTQAGHILLASARRALAAVAEARGSIASIGELTGTLTIGLVQTVPPELHLASLIRRFREVHPGVLVRLHRMTSPMFDELRHGLVDIGIGPSVATPGITATPLAHYPLALVTATAHPLSRRSHVSLRELADEAFIATPATWVTHHLVDRACADAGFERRVVAEANDVELMLSLVSEGAGVAILPTLASQFTRSVRFVPIRPTIGEWSPTVMHLDEPPNPAARAFLETLSSSCLLRAM
jgi:DNA-binding transcriptional LysR family regulator